MSNFFGLFGCFKGKQSADRKPDQGPTTIQDSQGRQGHERQNSQGKNAKVLPHGQNFAEKECARCGREIMSSAQKSVGSLAEETPDKKQQQTAKDRTSYAINADEKASGLCHQCQRKEGSAQANMEMASNGSHRDDVSQSTMAARSNKPFSDGNNTTMKGFEMSATMTTIDGSDKGRGASQMTQEELRQHKKLSGKYRSMRYKKYFIMEPEPHMHPNLEADVSAQRLKEEVQIYNALKSSERLIEVDGGLTYFLINADWVAKWRQFVQGSGPYPGKVHNEPIARKIAHQRSIWNDNRYAAHDNRIGLNEPQQVFCLSIDFWQMFEQRYHCDLVIQIRKYERVTDIVKQPIGMGDFWAAYEVQPHCHYEPFAQRLLKTPLAKRHSEESQFMDNLQSDGKAWSRYYAISSQWVQSWLAYVQASNKANAVHPGPVNNQPLLKSLLKMRDLKDSDSGQYYSVSKHLFYFFYAIYGGGPAIVQKSTWAQLEVAYAPMQEGEPIEETKQAPSRRPQQQVAEPAGQPKYDRLPDFKDGIVGLENNTFYCYMNACLQCLLPITELRNHYVMQRYQDVVQRGQTRTHNNFEFSNRIHDFYNVVFSKSSRDRDWVIRPTLKQVLRRRFEPIMQHDSHEFMVYLLEQLQDEQTLRERPGFNGTDPKKSIQQICSDFSACYSTLIDSTFSGIMQTTVKCGKCKHESPTFNPFMTQSLQHKNTLIKCLQDFCAENTIDDLYTCESCHKKTKAKVRHVLVKLPKVLVFHIKRFDSNFRKIEKNTSFGADLDMSQFCLQNMDARLRGSTNYRLFALTVHHGTLSGGHYVAFAKREDNRWYNFNDQHFEQVRESDALKQQAYLLFYRQVE